jgi:hypothetical protein
MVTIGLFVRGFVRCGLLTWAGDCTILATDGLAEKNL